jgi:FlgD Ig-like domain/NHL repeat
MTGLVAASGAGAVPGTLVAPPRAHTLGIHRVTSRELALFLPGFTLREPAGIAVARLDATNDPDTNGDDDEVTLVAVDRGSGALLTNFGLLRAGVWDGSGEPCGRLDHPTDAAIDRQGNVGVTDTGNHRVLVLHHDGKSLTFVGAFPGFPEPTGIAADGRGGFLVCDRSFQTVFHLDPSTGKRTTFGLEVAFDRPIDVATVPEGDTMANGKKRVVVVVDQDGQRLRVFDPAGSLKASRSADSLPVPDASFDAVDIDFYGNIFAVDRRGNRVHKLRDDLYPLQTFGTRDGDPGYRAPRGIAIHRRLGQVFITEEAGGSYLWIGTDVAGLEASAQGNGIAFSYVMTEDSRVNIRILDPQGHAVATLAHDAYEAAGPQQGTWDGTDAGGGRVPGGDYLLEITARATYASRSSFEARSLKAFALGRGSTSP